MTRAAEVIAGHQQKIKLLCFFTEGIRIGLQRTGKQIKCSLRLNTEIPHFSQCVVEQIPVFPINRNIRSHAGAGCRHTLEHGRGTHIAQDTAGAADCRICLL